MALTPEDGTGLAAADSFDTAANLVALATARGYTVTGSSDEIDAAARLAADYLCDETKVPYYGLRAVAGQALSWPRSGAQYRYGQPIGSTTIPRELKLAQALLMVKVRAGTTLQEDLANGGLLVQSRRVDVIATAYMQPKNAGAPSTAAKLFSDVIGILSPLLRRTNDVPLTPSIVTPDWDGTPLADDAYSVDGTGDGTSDVTV